MIDAGLLMITGAAIWWFTAFYGLLYIVPAIICMVVYTMRTLSDISDDRTAVKKFNDSMEKYNALDPQFQVGDHYGETPTKDHMRKPQYNRTHRTIGYMLGRWFVALFPVLNIFLALFDCLEGLVEECVEFLKRVFDINIIPKPKL
jgi:hypothetical protein